MNEAPRGISRKRLLIGLGFAAVSLGALYIVLPNLAGLGDTWRRLDKGEPGWLTAGLFLEIASFFCYVALFRGVIGHEAGIGWAQSYRITLASLAATMISPATAAGMSVKPIGLGPDRIPIRSPSPLSRTAPM